MERKLVFLLSLLLAQKFFLKTATRQMNAIHYKVYVGGVCFFMRSCCVSNTLQLVIPFMLGSSFGSMKIHFKKMYAQTQLQKWHHIIYVQGSSKRQFQFLFRQTMHVAYCTLVSTNSIVKMLLFEERKEHEEIRFVYDSKDILVPFAEMYIQGKKIVIMIFVCLGKLLNAEV